MEEKELQNQQSAAQAEGQESKSSQEVKSAEFPSFETEKHAEGEPDRVVNNKIDLLYDVSLPVSIELGRTMMLIKDILELERGSVIELDKLASEPVDVLVNGKKVAEGEVVVIDKHFGIRITSLVTVEERLKNTRR